MLLAFLHRERACEQAIEFCSKRDLSIIYSDCNRPDWAMYLLARLLPKYALVELLYLAVIQEVRAWVHTVQTAPDTRAGNTEVCEHTDSLCAAITALLQSATKNESTRRVAAQCCARECSSSKWVCDLIRARISDTYLEKLLTDNHDSHVVKPSVHGNH